ncbi:hypothetical protein MVEN_01073800 [Mycena venus]|uniref:DJ-1/PfpI domain-containing protein n=1 Tax=Mycena venus TaxID=2733690 RepID=A0A8H6Y7J3_9AGAR|nr:hypothetical protein MVEN_01073800 [Mycena venus]
MSDHSLPDEIISEILSPALKVSDQLFSDNTGVSPFAKPSESTSAYLLVCKSWLRVATPLLYNVVVLRSKAQAKALSIVLSENDQLGQFIKKLRVEGGYGAPMHVILKSSPNISDLFLTLEIYSSDNTNGLCKGLTLINPTRLILRDLPFRPLENKMVSQLIEALSVSLSKWDLRVFECPFTRESNRAEKIIRPLVKVKRLHKLSIPNADSLSWAYSSFKECPLEVIRIKKSVSKWERKELPFQNSVLMALLDYTEASIFGQANTPKPDLEHPDIAPSLNLFFVPMAGAPKDVQDEVWSRVLYFAMSVPERANNPSSTVPRRLPLLLVSKTFNQLGLPYYYAHTVLSTVPAISKFGFVSLKNPSIGPNIRSLSIQCLNFGTNSSGAQGNPMFTPILSKASGVTRVVGYKGFADPNDTAVSMEISIPWDTFEAMAKCSGSTLREFSARIGTYQGTTVTATVFDDLTVLRRLDWKSPTGFALTNIHENGFQSLEDLWITQSSQSFLTALSLMRLKVLRRVMLCLSQDAQGDPPSPEGFLKAHGHKLTDLGLAQNIFETLSINVFDVCPNLRSLTVLVPMAVDGPPDTEYLYSTRAIPSLVKITLDVWYLPRDKNRFAAWEEFFVEFDPKCFPNLHEVEVKCCEWPTSERDIAKSCWVRGKQYDILFLPAGPIPDFETGDHKVPDGVMPFIATQAPKAKYILSVCGGAVYLAFAGVLSGKKATTNKAFYRPIVAATPKDIQWVAKARWVVDGNVWTSSGVSAGSDMTLAFIEHLAGPRVTRFIRGMVEIREVTEEDDPFAEFHGLV